MHNLIVDTAKIMAKGQITLPKDIRNALGVGVGDRVTMIRQNDRVVLMNAALYAMRMLQEGMQGEFERAGIQDDDDVTDLVRGVRAEIES
jgi:AbrB family looped-hinge helix DNA binding protein